MADSTIGSLPSASAVQDSSLLVMEQSGTAMNFSGSLLKRYAQDSVSEYVIQASGYANAAEGSATDAANAAREANGYAGESRSAQTGAEAARDEANKAKRQIEDLDVRGTTLSPGSPVTVDKLVDSTGAVTLSFGIPGGSQGATGPQGPQGVQGPEGPRGISGVAVAAEGVFAFSVDDGGNLILSYEGDSAPDFFIGDADGCLYYEFAG